MNVEIIRTEAAQFPEEEYINGIFIAVRKYLLHVIILHILEYICVQKSLVYISKMALMFRQKLLLLSRRN